MNESSPHTRRGTASSRGNGSSGGGEVGSNRRLLGKGVSNGPGATGGQHMLVVSGLVVKVAGREVLSGIDLEVRSGEVHIVMGPNGAGKSTLAHVLMGRAGYEVVAGSVALDGVDLLELPTWLRAQAGLFLAMQDPVEVPGVGMSDMLGESFCAGGSANALEGFERLAGEMIEAEANRLGLDESIWRRSLNVELSGGERKKSETVQLGVLKPLFSVLDEIDSGLDVDAVRLVAKRVEQATDEWGMGVIAITHYRRLLKELAADRVHVLMDGVIASSGGPELAEEVEECGYDAVRRL